MEDGFFLKEILEVTRGRLLKSFPEKNKFFLTASKLCTDTRKMKRGDFFLALRGKNFDGNDFVPEAWRKGAVGAIVDRFSSSFPDNFLIIKVSDTLEALQQLASFYRQKLALTIVGITGSNGKTTVKELVTRILSMAYRVGKSPGNFNNQIGVPLSILQFSSRDQIGVLEMGMNQPGEIRTLARIVQPNIGVITNVHRAHLGLLGSMAEIARAKAEIIPFLNENKDNFLILNRDDSWTPYFQKKTTCKIFTFGMNRRADFRAQNVKDKGEKVTFDLLFAGGEKLTFSLPFPGLFNVYNVLSASAVGYVLDVPPARIKEAVESFSAPPLHYRIEKWEKCTIFNDCYNANPESVKSALLTLKKLKGKRKIAILGDMLELGKASPKLHQEIGKTAALLGIDALFTWGRFASYTAIGAREAGLKESFFFKDKETLVKRLLTYLSSGDCLLVKGSRETRMEELIQKLKDEE